MCWPKDVFVKKTLFQTDEWETLADSLSARISSKATTVTKDFLVRRTTTTKKILIQRTFDINRLGHNNLDRLLKKNNIDKFTDRKSYCWDATHGSTRLMSLYWQWSFVWAPAVLTQPIDSNQTNLPKLGLWWKTAKRWKCLNLTPGFESTISHWIQSSQSASQPGELRTFSSVILTGKNRASDVIGALPFSPLAIS